jgi:hypothetical protein
MLAIYLCYILLLLLYFTLTDAWLYEWTELEKHLNYGMSPVVHTTINLRSLVNFIVCAIVPLGLYWIVKLFVGVSKEK